MTHTGVTRRTLVIAIGLVVAAQAATVLLVYRMVSSRNDPKPAAGTTSSRATDGQGAPAVMPDRPGVRRVATPPPPSRIAMPPRQELPAPAAPHPASTAPWSNRPLDASGVQLADEIRTSADDLKLLADAQGRISDRTRRSLLAGRDVALHIAEKVGAPDRGDMLGQIVVGFMVRRVTLRESFRGSSVTPAAIDAAARADALAMAEGNYDARTREALEEALATLPDLTVEATP